MPVPQTEVILRYQGAELARATLPPGAYVIGRSPEVSISVDTPLLSRQHARLTIEDGGALLEDLGSSNGTFVDEQPVTASTRLVRDQSVRLGDIVLEVHSPPAPGAETPPPDGIRHFLPEEILAEKRYTIGHQIARGGMGAILDARQNATQRTVAMKVMLGAGDEGDVLRFIEEAQVTAQLDHPNIVPIYELGVDEQDQLFYTMKLVRGITLKKVLELLGQGLEATAKKYPRPALLTIFQKVCDAVAFAHAKGVIHRDLKPENIMLGDFGSVLVMDWGLAKVLGSSSGSLPTSAPATNAPRSIHASGILSARTSHGDTSRTLSGTIMGTPAYMSPEQARGEVDDLDARSDVYALGAILFEILHLRPAIGGRTVGEIVEKAARGEVSWTPRKPIPDSLLAVCRQALALHRTQRYQNVGELQHDLTAYQSGFATSAEHAGAWKQIVLLIKRHKATAAGLAAVLLVGATLGTKAVVEGRRAEREGARATKALHDLKETAPDLLRLAASDANFQNFAAAQKNVNATLALNPELREAYWQRAWNFLGMEDFVSAADALREAAKIDPGNAARAQILRYVDDLAARKPKSKEDASDSYSPIFTVLRNVGATGPAAVLIGHMRSTNEQRIGLVRQRLEAALGKEHFNANVTPTGYLNVKIPPGPGSDFANLRGLPIDIIQADWSRVASLEPLRGMRLHKLVVSQSPVSDLRPLTGMALFELNVDATDVSDLHPLAGMPLRIFGASGTQVADLEPLRGAPLEELRLGGTRVADLSPLTGAPLREVNLSGTKVRSLAFLADSPIEILITNGANAIEDLAPLKSCRHLVRLEINGASITDLSPLRGSGIKSLSMDSCRKISDFTPLLDLPQLESIACTNVPAAMPILRRHPTLKFISYRLPGEGNDVPKRPIAEFWATYDEQQKAGRIR